MAKKDYIKEIKKLVKTKKLIMGTERTIKNIKLAKIERVFLSSNCPADVEATVKYYSKLGKFDVVKIDKPNEELGVICRKPYSISVLSVLKGG